MSNDNALTNQQNSSQSVETGSPQVVSVRESLVTIDTGGNAIMKNEVGYICVGEERLMAEVLRIQRDTADTGRLLALWFSFWNHPDTRYPQSVKGA